MKIIYNYKDAEISYIPDDNALNQFTIDELAKKSVPYGIPYWIVDNSSMDMSTVPSGFGELNILL